MTATVVLALASAACYGLAAVLQHQAAGEQPPELSLRLGLVVQLVRHPRWLFGNVVDLAGFILQLLALRAGPLTVVEPILVTSLVFALPAAAWLARRRVVLGELAPAVAVAGGLALFLAVARPQPGHLHAPVIALVASSIAVAAFVTGTLAIARLVARSASGLLLAAGAGASFGYMAAAASLTWQEITHGAAHALGSWPPYAVAVSGIAGILLTQSAFSSGRLRLSLPMMTVVQPVVALTIGIVVFGEQITAHGAAPVWESLGLAIAMGAVFLLARPAVGD
ncbi:MAG: DMT family transporter [Actinomycetota bacterium]|jgi:hypothetical protein|nr:DMT family transporter [Actinomycetota bacterium]